MNWTRNTRVYNSAYFCVHISHTRNSGRNQNRNFQQLWHKKKSIWSLSLVPGTQHLSARVAWSMFSSNIWCLTQFVTQELLRPLESPEWRASFCRLMRWLRSPRKLQDGDQSPERPSHDEKLKTFSSTPILWGWETAGDWVHNWWCQHDKASIKIPKIQGSKSFWETHPHARRVVHPNSTGTEAAALWTLSDLTVCTSAGCLPASVITPFIT